MEAILGTLSRSSSRTAEVLRIRLVPLHRQSPDNSGSAAGAQFTEGVVDVQVVTRSQNLTLKRVQKTVLAP